MNEKETDKVEIVKDTLSKFQIDNKDSPKIIVKNNVIPNVTIGLGRKTLIPTDLKPIKK